MKRLFLLLSIAATLQAKSQAFIGMGIGNSITATGGILVNQFQLSASYSHPFSSTIRPAVTSLELGRQIFIGETGSLTISAGGSKCTYTLVENNEKISKVNEFKAIYGAELGIDRGMGRVSLYTKYCGVWVAGVGIKFFFN